MLAPFDSLLTTALVALATLAGVIYWYCTNTFDYWKKKGVPHEPPKALFGNTKESILRKRSVVYDLQDLYERFEGHPYVGIYMMKRPYLMLRDPELIKAILVKDFNNFPKRDMTTTGNENPLLQHLFALHGHKWRVLRHKLSPTFTSGKMKGMFHLMDEACKNLVSYLQEPADKKEIVEMREAFAKLTTDIIGTCAFGLEMNSIKDPDSQFRRMGKKIFEPTLKRILFFTTSLFLPELGKWVNLDPLGKDITDFFIGVVKDTTEYRVKNKVNRNDFMQLLINLRYTGEVDDSAEEKKAKNALDFEFDDGLMAAQAFVFFLAGFETSSTTMSFALHELAVNPDVQSKLRAEIDAELAVNGGKFTYESVMNMKYLDKVVSETLRMYPPVQYLRREATSPYTLPGTDVQLEKGVAVAIPIFSLQRDPKHYPDPERFDPERFSEEEKAKRHHYAYLPFGEGPRNCIGMRFGLLQSKLGLATLLSKYEFHVCEKTAIPLQISATSPLLASTTGTNVRITKRS